MSTMDRPQTEGAPVPIQVTDRRPRFDGEGTTDTPEGSPEPRYPSFVAELQARVRAAEGKLAEALDLLRRREAEADDFRARLRREMERRSRAQVEACLRDLLEVVDSLDRGAASGTSETDPAVLREGFLKVRDQFLSSLARQGVEAMKLLGTPYDPNRAEAVAVSPTQDSHQNDRVVEEIRRGYTFAGEVLRPAQVRVARLAGETPSSQQEVSPKERPGSPQEPRLGPEGKD